MPNFKYKAKNGMGKIIEGIQVADNEADLSSQLKQKRLELISATKTNSKGSFKGGGVTTHDLVVFSRQFSVMVNSGLPVLQGLSIIAEQAENKAFREVMTRVRDDITNGVPLSDAMGKYPKVFSTLYVNMIKAGEQGGILDKILERLSDYLEKADALAHKVKSAMTYPVVVMVVAVSVIIFLMVGVIPTFEEVFSSFGGKLPPPTRLVIGISKFLSSSKALYLLGFIVAAFIALKFYRKTKVGAYNWDKFMLRLPVFGDLVRKSSIAKFSKTLGTLVASGVPIMDALDTVSKTSGNLVVERAVISARDAIREGKTLSEPLKKSGVFPPMVTQMINVGEETGALDKMLLKIADFYESEVDVIISGLTSIIEPILIVFLGVSIGFIVVAMFLPMFELGNLIG